MEDLIPVILNMMTLASILMMVGLGLAIIYGLMDLINFAHGEFVTIGAYTLIVVNSLGGSYWLALLLSPIVGGIVGVILERIIIRNLYARPIAIILATYGISLILRQSIQLIFGAGGIGLSEPVTGSLPIFGVEYPAYRLFLISSSFIIMGGCYIIFRYTNFGLDVRTVIQNRDMAEALGINTRRVYLFSFGAGAGLAAVAGVLVAPLGTVFPHMGINYLAKSFFVVIVGGVGNIMGVAVGSSFIGGLETLLNYQIPVSLSQALVLIMAIIIVRFRPQGLIPV
jgi:branched-chain amino acid transport system permease protein/urea transport system permease protein